MAKVKRTEPMYTKSGVEITPELEERLADEAERGYDLSDARRQYVGRPSLGGDGVSPRISFRASRELNTAAQRRADEEGRSLSDLAREALERYLSE